MSNHIISDVAKTRVRELNAAGYSLRQIQAAVGVSRDTVIEILRGTHRPRAVSAEVRQRYEDEDERRRLTAFRAEVARRRFLFERDWDNREPWIERVVANWNPPAGVL